MFVWTHAHACTRRHFLYILTYVNLYCIFLVYTSRSPSKPCCRCLVTTRDTNVIYFAFLLCQIHQIWLFSFSRLSYCVTSAMPYLAFIYGCLLHLYVGKYIRVQRQRFGKQSRSNYFKWERSSCTAIGCLSADKLGVRFTWRTVVLANLFQTVLESTKSDAFLKVSIMLFFKQSLVNKSPQT